MVPPLLSQSHSHHVTCTVQNRVVSAAGHPGQRRQHRPRARPHRGRSGRRRQARRPAGKSPSSSSSSSPSSFRLATELKGWPGKGAHEARIFRDVTLFQEIWNCPYATETLPSYAEDIDGGGSPSVSMLSEVAATRKITIVGGSIPERSSRKLFNTCCVIGPDGEIKAKHSKLHLFGIDIPGDITLRESDTVTAGQGPTVVDTDVGRIGIGICHDIRFPELAMLYRSRGAHLICYPSAFNMSTGQLLWDLMQKSRAVDNQLFVATCSPARDPDSQSEYMIWGHSSLIGPFGEVLAAAGHEEATVVGEIDLTLIDTVRENLPLEMQRRGDLYQLVDVQREYYAS